MLTLHLTFSFLLLLFLQVANAQFNIFDMFHQQAHQQQRPPASGGTSQWASHADSIPCNAYLCPETLVCARQPIDCPCPVPEDEKCIIRDAKNKDAATVVCIRGKDGCAEVERLTSLWK